MLKIYHELPDGLLEAEPQALAGLLGGPSLIHLDGRRQDTLFASVLLHGNETTGFRALQRLLQKYAGSTLPRNLSFFAGNVVAASLGLRRLDHQPDYNRIWMPGDTEEQRMTQQVVEAVRARQLFACVDIHNNTGLNPHYACVNRITRDNLHLASLFSRTVVYFTRPEGVLTSAFSPHCPAVVLECGQPEQEYGTEHVFEFLDGCLHMDHFPEHGAGKRDIHLFHTVATVKVPESVSFSFREDCELRFNDDLDHLNFRELPAGTEFARVQAGSEVKLEVTDEYGRDVSERYFSQQDDSILTAVPVMPSMLTLNETVIRQDCLCYLMERMSVDTDIQAC